MRNVWDFCCGCVMRAWRGSFATANSALSTLLGGPVLAFLAFYVIGEAPQLAWSQLTPWFWYVSASLGLGWAAVFMMRLVAAPYHLWRDAIQAKEAAESRLAEYEGTPALDVVFDPDNPQRQFWTPEPVDNPDDEGNRVIVLEYRVLVRNISNKTVRGVRATAQTLGPLPKRPFELLFDINKSPQHTLNPGTFCLLRVLQWPYPPIQEGMVGGDAYGPLEVTVSGEDIPPVVRRFRLNYEQEPMLSELPKATPTGVPSPR